MAKTPDPSVISRRFAAIQPKWQLVDALFGGTSTMRLGGKSLLPKDTLESDEMYQTRLERSTLFNAYRRSIQQAVARLFSQDIKLTQYPLEIVTWAQDVDAQGRDITQFIKADAEDAINHGISYVLIEFPSIERQPGETPTYTAEDALKTGHRPYWVPIFATQVLAAHSKLIGGVEFLTHFRFKEEATEVSADGLEEETVEQIRAFYQDGPDEPVTWKTWRLGKSTWEVYGEGVLQGPPTIPAVEFPTKKAGFFLGEPPLMDLAETNLAHWQSSSEQRNILHFARVPFLHINGWSDKIEIDDGKGGFVEKKVELNIHRALLTDAPHAKAEWVETNGRALEAGAADLVALEGKMDILGLSLSTPKSGNATATENSINAAESNSMLKDIARSFSDGLERALYLTSFYLGVALPPEAPGRVEIDTSFAVDLEETADKPPQKEAQTT